MTASATFYLGTHQPHWLADPRFRDVPLFVSSRRLMGRKTLPRAVGRWAQDSGGFTELKMHGRWTITTAEYVSLTRWYAAEIGRPDFVAPMDWMCEPWVIQGRNRHLPPSHRLYFHGTRAARGIPDDGPDESLDDATEKHLIWTVDNVVELRRLGLDVKPVLQGWKLKHYKKSEALYLAAGVDLAAEPIVGLGSVCRRQHTPEIAEIVGEFAGRYRLHGFGVKTDGLELYGHDLTSADSQAWSEGERRRGYPLFPECVGVHKNCANCPKAALLWRGNVLAHLGRACPRAHQPRLFDVEELTYA